MGKTRSRTGKLPKMRVKSVQSFLWSLLLSSCLLAALPNAHTLLCTHTIHLNNHTHLYSNSWVSSMSRNSQFQGATVFKALVQRGFKLHPNSVWVVLLGLGLMAAHHLERKQDRTKVDRSGQSHGWTIAVNNWCSSHLASLVGSVLLEDVAGSDHHPGCLYPVECSALLLLHQDLINKTNKVAKWSIALSVFLL